MLRSWFIRFPIVPCVLLGFASSLTAQDPSLAQKGQVELIRKQLGDLAKSLGSNYEKIAQDVADIKHGLDSIRDGHTDLQLKLIDSQNRIEKLEKAVGQLQGATQITKKTPFSDQPNQPAPIAGGDPKNGGPSEIDPALAPILSRLKTLESQVGIVQAEVEKLKKNLTTKHFYPPKDLGLDDIKSRLGQLEKQIADMNSGKRRIAKASPSSGSLRLVNTCQGTVLFLINGRPERVAEGAIRIIDAVTPGSIQYEVISPTRGTSGRITTILNAGETLTLTAY